jgi:hypothetical protein
LALELIEDRLPFLLTHLTQGKTLVGINWVDGQGA